MQSVQRLLVAKMIGILGPTTNCTKYLHKQTLALGLRLDSQRESPLLLLLLQGQLLSLLLTQKMLLLQLLLLLLLEQGCLLQLVQVLGIGRRSLSLLLRLWVRHGLSCNICGGTRLLSRLPLRLLLLLLLLLHEIIGRRRRRRGRRPGHAGRGRWRARHVVLK